MKYDFSSSDNMCILHVRFENKMACCKQNEAFLQVDNHSFPGWMTEVSEL